MVKVAATAVAAAFIIIAKKIQITQKEKVHICSM